MDKKLQNSIKAFASEAGRFKLQDLANILGIEDEELEKIINNLVSKGELKGIFAHKKSEFVTKDKLKEEVTTILDNPNLIEPFNYIQKSNIDSEHGKEIIFSTFAGVKKCPICNISIKTEGNFCPKCGKPIG